MYRLKILNPDVMAPDARVCAEAASRGIEVLVIEHLRKKNDNTKPNRYGLPKSNYYAEASNDVAASASGNKAKVEISYPGISKHYEGGTIYPKPGKKALAIPIDPEVAGIWPSEYDPTEKHEKTFISPGGAIGDRETGKILYILLPKVNIPEDKSVLPTDDEIVAAVGEAIREAQS